MYKNITLAKIDVAERQLRTAIRLFFAESDPVSIETLAGAANGVLRGIAASKGVKSILHDGKFIKPEYRKEWIQLLHESQNFFKHADRDTDAKLEFRPEWIKFVLLEACHLYRHLASANHLNKGQLKEAICFEIWFSMSHPQYLIDPEKLKHVMTGFNLSNVDPKDFEIFRMALKFDAKNI
jgi:hypothetical protein